MSRKPKKSSSSAGQARRKRRSSRPSGIEELVYRLIVETMKEAAFTLTFDGRILFGNVRFGEFVKRPLEQVVGHPLREFVAPHDAAAAEALLVAGQTEPVKQRLVFQATDGTTVPAHVSTTVLHEPDHSSICVVATDLTELERSTEIASIASCAPTAPGRTSATEPTSRVTVRARRCGLSGQ